MKNVVIFIFILLGIIEAQEELAIINDPDGYANIHKEKNEKSEILSKVLEKQIFYYQPENQEDWWKVRLSVFTGEDIEGYMQKSRILPIDNLSSEAKKNLILYIFNTEINMCKNYLDHKISDWKFEEFHDTQLVPILVKIFPKYVCVSKDTTVLLRFFDIINLETGSADETPDWVLGKIFICEPNFTIKILSRHSSDFLLNNLELGFLHITYQKEKEVDNFDNLKFKLDSLIDIKYDGKKCPNFRINVN